jgi:transketolase C-terminal domain/subunit
VLGEDVADLGGVFGATRRLRRTYGPDRVLDTPISETAFVGAAIGAAQAGLRPVVELMFVDFLGVCFDQIMNQMAKARYMSGGAVTGAARGAHRGRVHRCGGPALAGPVRHVRAHPRPEGRVPLLSR